MKHFFMKKKKIFLGLNIKINTSHVAMQKLTKNYLAK